MLIVLEGVDGIGKSTLAKTILSYLMNVLNKPAFVVSELDTILGSAVRLALQDEKIDKRNKLLMIQQLRRSWMKDMIANLIYQGMIVIMDRFVMSTLVYQDVPLEYGTEEFKLYQHYAFNHKIMTLLFTTNNHKLLINNLDKNDKIEMDVSLNIDLYQDKFLKAYDFLKTEGFSKNIHHIELTNRYANIIDIIPYINDFIKQHERSHE